MITFEYVPEKKEETAALKSAPYGKGKAKYYFFAQFGKQ
jgi:hypothetical protein